MSITTKFIDKYDHAITFSACNLLIAGLYILIGVQSSFLISALVIFFLMAIGLVGYNLLKRPALGIALLVFSSSLDTVGKLMPEATYSLSLFHVFVLFSIVALILKKLIDQNLSFAGTNFDVPLIFFLLLSGMSLLWSPNQINGFIDFLRLAALVGVMYLVINSVKAKNEITTILLFLFLSAFALSLLGTYDLITNPMAIKTTYFAQMNRLSRSASTFENPNYFAAFLLLPMLMATSFLLNYKQPLKIKLLLLGLLGICGAAFVGTFSRGAWVALFPGLFLIFFFSKRKKEMLALSGLVISGAIILLIGTPLLGNFLLRFTSILDSAADQSGMTRVYLIMGALKMLLNSYLIGVGFRGFPIEYSKYMPARQALFDVKESHTLPFEVIAELGVIGFMLIAIIFYRYFKFGLHSINNITDNFLKTWQIGLLSTLLALLTFNLFSPGGLLNNYLWIVIGLTFACDRIFASLSTANKTLSKS